MASNQDNIIPTANQDSILPTANQDNIIMNAFSEKMAARRARAAIETALHALSAAHGELDLRTRARAIARMGDQVLPVLLTMLGTTDPQIRGGLGQVAASLHAAGAPVIESMRAAAQDNRSPDQVRITAITILERFLGQAPDETLYATLSDPRAIMLNSVREMLVAAQQSEYVYIEYVQQLESQPLEVVLDLINSLDAIEPEGRLVLLRLLAQDSRDVVAAQAVNALGRIRMPAAVVGLRCLLPTVSPATRALVDRNLRKLALTGVSAEPPPQPERGWRALVSGVDGDGYRAVWFVAPTRAPVISLYKPGEVTFLGVLLGDAAGIRLSFANASLPEVRIPGPHLAGTFCELLIPHSDQPLRLLEAPFDYGRSLVAAAVQLNYESQAPIAHEFRLLNPLIWQFGEPASPPLPDLPPLAGDLAIANLRQQSRALLDHRAFSSWFVHSEAAYDLAERLLDSRRPAFPTVDMLVQELVTRDFSPISLIAYRRRLLAMVPWLAFAGDLSTAALARHLAASLQAPADLSHPFLLELARAGVERAVSNLRWGYDLRTSPAPR